MNDEGMVVGIDHISELVNLSKENISKSHKNLLENGTIVLDQADGRMGYKPYAPYDVIHVGAGNDITNLYSLQASSRRAYKSIKLRRKTGKNILTVSGNSVRRK